METPVSQVIRGRRLIEDGDMTLIRVLPDSARGSLGPFVFVDHYRHAGRRGIGDAPHPHAGIEVLSYLLDGEVEHRDSMGNRDRLGSGDAQAIRAGRGMLHMETPLSGRHGLQLWISLPPALKSVEPGYQSVRAADIPERVTDAYRLRVVAGEVDGLRGPLTLSGDATFAHLSIRPGRDLGIGIPADLELGLYVMQGRLALGDDRMDVGDLAVLRRTRHLRCRAEDGDLLQVALLGGGDLVGDVLFAGPFVMDTPARLKQAQQDYAAGRMGRLDVD